ncbi:MAG: hypothetical protein N3F64_03700 [Nitrososphaeria archaeon]|nr:hypothetical protein [Nitrososphaeria archaeon]
MPNWRCKCPLCRLIVLPIFNQMLGNTSEIVESVPLIAETLPPNTIEGLHEETVAESANIDVASLNDKISSIVTESVNSAVEKVEKDLLNNLSKVSEEIAQLRSELSETVKNFNDAIKNLNELAIELRTSMSDMGNPFFVHESNGNGLGKSNGHKINPKVVEKILRDLWKYSENIDSSTLKELLQDYVDSGVVEKETGEVILKLVDHMYRLKPKGFTVEDSIRLLQTIKGVGGNGR